MNDTSAVIGDTMNYMVGEMNQLSDTLDSAVSSVALL